MKRLPGHVCTIIIYSLIAAGFLYVLEQSVGVSYAIKTSCKVVLFLVFPLLYSLFFLKKDNSSLTQGRVFHPKDLAPGLIVGIISFAAIVGAYLLLGTRIDFASIADELQNKLGITPLNFLFIGLYITFINSLLEEYFFRNFIFLNLYKKVPHWFSYIFSSLLFALYHMAIFIKWFTLPILFLSLFGLFIVGLAFNYMNRTSGHFLNSWLAHIIADSAIILIGMRMFGIL